MRTEERPGRPSSCDQPGWGARVGHRKRTAPPPPCTSLAGLLVAYAALVARTSPRTDRPARWVALAAIGVYRHTLTRWTASCPQDISCSEFALQAVRECGPVTGLRLAAYRIAHCGQPQAEGHPIETPGCGGSE